MAKQARKTCIVPTCQSSTTRTPEKLFLHVPDQLETRNKWLKAIGRAPEKTRGNCYCCEDHFNLEDDIANYNIFKAIGGRKRVKPGVVPHKNLPPIFDSQIDSGFDETAPELKKQKLIDDGETNLPCSQRTQTSFCSEELAQNTHAAPLDQQQLDIDLSEQTDSSFHTISGVPTKEPIQESLLYPEESCAVFIVRPPKVDNLSSEPTVYFYKDANKMHKCVQTNTQKLCKPKVKSVSIQVDEKALCIQNQLRMVSTGIQTDKNIHSSWERGSCRLLNKFENEDILNTSVDTVDSLCTDSSMYQPTSESATHTSEREMKLELLQEEIYEKVTKLIIEKDPLLFLGVPKGSLYVLHEISEITHISFKNITLTLKKIRQNHVNATLAYDFGYTDRHVARIFESTVPVLAQVLKKLIFWPSRDIILKDLPIAFRHSFKKVQSIIDSLEIETEKPGNAFHQAATWSEYKKCNTWKYLISITPSGSLNYLSKGFSGRTTDSNLVENSGYLDVLPPGCEILADRGFKNVSALIEMHHCKIIVPCSVKSGEKSSEADVRKSKAISSCRIHVERVIERIREFKFLDIHSCVDNKNVHLLDDIIMIAGALVNLQERVIQQ